LELLENHRRRGDLIVLVSASTPHLIQPIKTYLGVDHAFCTHLAYDGNDRCLGRPRGAICIHGEKKRVVDAFARSQGIDLACSHAYSDHHADIPFLASVGHPVCINPTVTLETHARKLGWPRHYF
ncbi:MAG: HAD-IB family phosphatase, partial [Desulfovibrionales bacterium]|nr:HAD-IB family phosphatase [Desulfovibrionales bacterium]